jgi:hypothetical protein
MSFLCIFFRLKVVDTEYRLISLCIIDPFAVLTIDIAIPAVKVFQLHDWGKCQQQRPREVSSVSSPLLEVGYSNTGPTSVTRAEN